METDEHVLRELYLLPFEMLVLNRRIAAIMSAYNRVRGTYATESRYLLHDILRRFTQMFRFEQFGKEYDPGQIDAAAHGAASRRIGAQLAVASVDKVTVARDLSNLDEAVAAAGEADQVIIMAGMVATEGADGTTSHLAHEQDRMIETVLEADPSAAVVLRDSTPC